MPANTTPIFPLTPDIQWNTAAISSANGLLDGTGTSSEIFIAGANGTRIDQIVVQPLGTNIATVLRFFINNGSTSSVAANNALAHEVALPANTISQTTASFNFDIVLNKDGGATTLPPIQYLPAGYTIRGSVGTTIAAGLKVTIYGGDY